MTFENFHLLTNKSNYKTKLNPFAVTCQCTLETGYFKSELALKANNYAGIKATKDWKGEVYNVDSPEYINGKKYIKRSSFRKYSSADDFVKDYISSKLNNSRYDKVRKYGLDNYFSYFYFIWECGWATDIAYFEKLVLMSFTLGPKLITSAWNNKAKAAWEIGRERILNNCSDKAKAEKCVAYVDNYFKKVCLTPIPVVVKNNKVEVEVNEEVGEIENEFIEQLDQKLPDDSTKWKICLDAGHGGKDPGAINKKLEVNEKDINLKVVLELGKILEATNNFEVVYTRTDDSYMSVNEKAAVSNKNNCNLMLSVHCNSSTSTSATGHEDIYFGKDSKFSAKGKEFATYINESWNKKFTSVSSNLKNRGCKIGNFAVVRETKCPAVLTELEFISNDNSCNFMTNNITDIAECLAEGICNYLTKKK